MSIITRSTDAPNNVTRIAEWQPRFDRVKRGEACHPIAELKSSAKTLYLTEAAIECSLREYGKDHGLTRREIAAAIQCGLRVFRHGSSAATAIGEGRKTAREFAWGAKTDPKGVA